MLEDFLKANEVSAEIIKRRLSVNVARCVLLMPKGPGLPVLAVFPAGHHICLEKAEKHAGFGLKASSERETLNVTGYRQGFIPPISIYGVKVLVDESLLEKSSVNFPVSEELTLRISPALVLELNEDSLSCGLV